MSGRATPRGLVIDLTCRARDAIVDTGTGGIMIVWLFEAVWHALLGLILLVGFFGGAVFVIGREIGKGAQHDFATCQCLECRKRRDIAHKKRVKSRVVKLAPVRTGMTATEALRTGDTVEAKGMRYEVVSLVGRAAGGIQVTLVNLGTGRKSIVPVSRDRVSIKLWKMV